MLQGKKQILTIYFSRRGETPMDGELQTITKGHSEMVAESIQKAVGGDIFEIQPAIPYDESYEKCLIRARKELSGDERPELKAYPENFDKYDITTSFAACASAPLSSKKDSSSADSSISSPFKMEYIR